MGFKEGIKELISNKNFMLLFFVFIMIFGFYSSLSPIYGSLASIYKYSIGSIGINCLLFLLGGIISAFIMGAILDKYQNYKKMLIIICSLSIATSLLHFATLPFGNPMVEGACMLLLGIAIIPI
jgi:sugar phosphate permease